MKKLTLKQATAKIAEFEKIEKALKTKGLEIQARMYEIDKNIKTKFWKGFVFGSGTIVLIYILFNFVF